MVYIAGNNSLGQSDFDSKDVSEMIEGMKGTEGTTNNLLVYFAGYKKTAKLIRLIKNGKGEVKQETVMSYDKHNSVNRIVFIITHYSFLFHLAFSIFYQTNQLGSLLITSKINQQVVCCPLRAFHSFYHFRHIL